MSYDEQSAQASYEELHTLRRELLNEPQPVVMCYRGKSERFREHPRFAEWNTMIVTPQNSMSTDGEYDIVRLYKGTAGGSNWWKPGDFDVVTYPLPY